MELTKTKFKQTELGLIPEDWEVLTLRDVGEVKMCRRIFHNQTKEQGNIPFYKIGTFGKVPDAFITKELYEEYRGKFSFPKVGDILISAAGTIGRTIVYGGEDAYFQDSNIVWIENNNRLVSNKYLKYIYQVVKYRTEGNTIQRLYNSIIYDTAIICPPLPEQKAIAQVLSDTDTLIQTLEQKLNKKIAIKQGAMQQLLSTKEGWVIKKLGEIAHFYNGKAHEQFIDAYGEFTVINSKFVSTSGNVSKNSTLNLSPLKKGDITMVMSDIPNGKALAKCFIVPIDNKYALNQRICAIRAETVDNDFLYLILNRNEYYLAFDSGTGQTNLKKNDVLQCPIPLPKTIYEQTQIANILFDMDAEIAQLEQKLDKYKLLKQGLMQELLTGRIRLL